MAREDGIHETEVHVAGICFGEIDGAIRCLIAQRTDQRRLFPGRWECGGGQVAKGESFGEAIHRQMKEEFGLNVEVLYPCGTYAIRTEGKVIPGIKFVCLCSKNQSVQIDSKEHVRFEWVLPEEARHFDTISGIPEDIQTALALYHKLGPIPVSCA